MKGTVPNKNSRKIKSADTQTSHSTEEGKNRVPHGGKKKKKEKEHEVKMVYKDQVNLQREHEKRHEGLLPLI